MKFEGWGGEEKKAASEMLRKAYCQRPAHPKPNEAWFNMVREMNPVLVRALNDGGSAN